MFRGWLVFFSWGLGRLFIAHRPVSLVSSSLLSFVWESLVSSGTSASFGSPVPFATWSPFGTSQGLWFPLSRSGLRVPFPWWSPFGSCLRFNYSSDSFASAVPLATWSPFGMSLAFLEALSRSSSRFLTGGVLLFVLVQFGCCLGLLQALSLVYFRG